MTVGSKQAPRVLITGGAGFLGSHLVKSLLSGGNEVIVLDNGSTKNLEDVKSNPKLEIIQASVTDPFPSHILASRIYHLACHASPKQFGLRPLEILETCYTGTKNALEAARKWNARILLASTSEVYGNPEVCPQPETYNGNVNCFGPRACYDEGKRVVEALAFAYRKQYSVDLRIARIFNVYGPGMPASDGRVVCSFVDAAIHSRDLVITGDGAASRCFQYVSDCVEGLRLLMESSWSKGPVNIGSETETTMAKLAGIVVQRLAAQKLGRSSRIVYKDAVEDDPQRRRPDWGLARRVLGWEPRVSLETGIDRTVAWFLAAEDACR
ncbi:hypothetical protein PRZ48_000813 [Zasmidium cellare]|uniref:UDP-glucuronate decarboxylase n=1 Tax=Zasmidium cellare TaxID=395010 RepID=A0ABR0EZJ3_ZASCE|nr:hypothetical protein PRZ48_000813 [Zasmidium cellare]